MGRGLVGLGLPVRLAKPFDEGVDFRCQFGARLETRFRWLRPTTAFAGKPSRSAVAQASGPTSAASWSTRTSRSPNARA